VVNANDSPESWSADVRRLLEEAALGVEIGAGSPALYKRAFLTKM
jgi:hypothetical protein